MAEEQQDAQAEAQTEAVSAAESFPESQSSTLEETRLGERGEALHYGDSALQPFIVAAVVTALVMGLVILADAISTNPAWQFLPYIVFGVAIEAIITTRWLGAPERRYLNRAGYRAAEFIAITAVLRLLTWILGDGFPNAAAWRGYLLSPLSFLDGVFVGYVICVAWAWERAIRFSSLLMQLRLTHAELDYYSLPARQRKERYPDRPIDRERPFVFADLVRSWLSGGFVLAFLAAMTSVEFPTISVDSTLRTINRLGLRPEMLMALLVYFLLGLWLISQARLSMVRARWLADGVASRPGVIAAWHRASLLLLILVAVIAAFLPIGSTFGAAVILNAIISVIAAGIQILFYLLSLLSLFLAGLFFTGEIASEPTPTPSPVATPTPIAVPGPVSETPALIAGGIFWVLIGAVALIAFVVFLRDRGVQLPEGALQRWWLTISSWLHSFLRGATQNISDAGRAVARRLRTVRSPEGSGQSPWRFIRVNALPPREQIRYYYLSTVRRAGERGVSRAGSETPSEYARDLKENWPEAQEEIDALTEAFLEARYSQRQFESEDVNPVKAVWRRVRNSLRRQRRGESELATDGQIFENKEDDADQEDIEDDERDGGVDEV